MVDKSLLLKKTTFKLLFHKYVVELNFILVIIGLLVCLLLFIFTIYFKSKEGSSQKLISGKLVGIILIPIIFLLFKLTTKSLDIGTEIKLAPFGRAIKLLSLSAYRLRAMNHYCRAIVSNLLIRLTKKWKFLYYPVIKCF